MSPDSGSHTATSKGVHREVVSERSWRQSSGLTYRNFIRGIQPWERLLHKPKPDTYCRIHKKSQSKFLQTIRYLTRRSNGKGYAWLKVYLTRYIRGWLTYCCHADMVFFIKSANKYIDQHNNHRTSNAGRVSVNIKTL